MPWHAGIPLEVLGCRHAGIPLMDMSTNTHSLYFFNFFHSYVKFVIFI